MSIYESLTGLVRRFLVGKEQKFIFGKVDPDKFIIPSLKKTNLYIHIPFCKSMCPYCPYNRIRYNKELVKPYVEALLKEIKMYREKLGKIEISSIYVGGGTPTNLIDELGIILKEIRKNFVVSGEVAIETTVSDINRENVKKLKSYGVNLVSLGVQSFQDKYLKFLGRDYKESNIAPAIELLKSFGFALINVDLMFALKDQTVQEVMYDLKKAVESGVDQITTYPLFTFPYSTIGKYKKLKKVKMPGLIKRRKMYKTIHNYMIENNFNRVSVWGFSKKEKKYSSVTRNHYIGFGAGAASKLSNIFYFNTFSVLQYINYLSNNKLPVAISMDITEKLDRYYWFYWKLYETEFDINEMNRIFGEEKRIKFIFSFLKKLNFIKKVKNKIILTEKGSFYIHLLQNYFILFYISRVWKVCSLIPWPEKIKI